MEGGEREDEGRGTYVEGGWKRGGNTEMEVEGVGRMEVELEVERESRREVRRRKKRVHSRNS